MKRLVICCDGTWNELDYKARPVTNVVKLAQSVRFADSKGVAQIVFYDEGVGTLERESAQGGGFGDGLIQNIMDAYTFLAFNYDPGDEIYIFGFSRGAYTARSLAGMIRNCGIVRRDCIGKAADALRLYRNETIRPHDKASIEFRRATNHSNWWVNAKEEPELAAEHPDKRLTVTYLGVWDTVGQLGVPGVFNALARRDEDAGFHDLKLSSFVQRARHAVAIDEQRAVFRPTLWDDQSLEALRTRTKDDPALKSQQDGPPYQQVWFPGDHGSVGGGGDICGLSDHALQWVAEGARKNGASLDYDEKFETVFYPVTLRPDGDDPREAAAIRFAPALNVALSNISKAYEQAKKADKGFFGSVLGGVVGHAMDLPGPDRIELLASAEQLSWQARVYDGKIIHRRSEISYRERLKQRLAGHAGLTKSEIKAAFDNPDAAPGKVG